VLALADRLLARAASPSEALGREELKQRVRAALDRLSGFQLPTTFGPTAIRPPIDPSNSLGPHAAPE